MPWSCIMKNTSKARCRIEYSGWDVAWEVGAKAGIDSDGGKANTDPGLPMTSGFGGLGLEGIVGNEDSDGV